MQQAVKLQLFHLAGSTHQRSEHMPRRRKSTSIAATATATATTTATDTAAAAAAPPLPLMHVAKDDTTDQHYNTISALHPSAILCSRQECEAPLLSAVGRNAQLSSAPYLASLRYYGTAAQTFNYSAVAGASQTCTYTPIN